MVVPILKTILTTLLVTASTAACHLATKVPSGASSRTFSFGGASRTYVVYAPKVELSRYADAKGNIDFQKLTCGQLANTPPQDADVLGALYIGWHNGLAKKNAINVMRIKDVIRDLVVHCRANKDQRVTQAIDFIRNRQAR